MGGSAQPPDVAERIGLVESAGLCSPSQQDLLFWECFITTNVWVVGLGYRAVVEDKSH